MYLSGFVWDTFEEEEPDYWDSVIFEGALVLTMLLYSTHGFK